MNLRAPLQRSFTPSDGSVLFFVLLFTLAGFLTRLLLLAKAFSAVSLNGSLLAALGWGFVFDFGAGILCAIPLMFFSLALPNSLRQRPWAPWIGQAGVFLTLYLLLFTATAEWLFWDEFGVRFNFIAVDYLVYTKEVIDNIRESYPMPLLLAALFGLAFCIHICLWQTGWTAHCFNAQSKSLRSRVIAFGSWLAAAMFVATWLNEERLPVFTNNYNRELAKNGVWSLFAAFRNNQLDYDEFYPTIPIDRAFAILQAKLQLDGSEPLGPGGRDTLRFVRNEGPELHPNVIQITVESLSASFLATFNPSSTLTPFLDALASKSLVYEQFYATGTRTDRGMEALSLSLPPTPGRSLVKRPHNENLFTLGSVFRSRGYDTAFIYGGFGYFDNMNHFFGRNGYRIVDRASVSNKDISFANAWGACDEDLYRWTLREANAAHVANKPFHFFVMTTSNHRPFTYPEGCIDLPSKISGRAGAVKYSDHAIGEFLRDAAAQPWFRNTIFVVVGDHCASVAGKTALPVQNYHVPLLIYSPGGQLAPRRVRELMSQVDYAPTLLGLLNWSYASRFYGRDLHKTNTDHRALIGTYQKLGLFKDGALSVLQPVRQATEFDFDASSFVQRPRHPVFTEEAAAYYQTASYLYRNRLYRPATDPTPVRLVLRKPAAESRTDAPKLEATEMSDARGATDLVGQVETSNGRVGERAASHLERRGALSPK